jgi:thiol:disulfide interchange protein DsbD
MKRFYLLIALTSVLGLFVRVQSEEPIVSVKVIPSAEKFKLGQTYELSLELSIRAPYHINSDQPTEDFLIPTTVDFALKKGVSFGRVIFPPAEMRKLELSENPLSIYEGKILIKTSVTLAADFKEKELLIEGRIGYQACDERSCLAPTDIAFSRKIPVEAAVGVTAGAPQDGATKEVVQEQKTPTQAKEPTPAPPSPAAASTATPSADVQKSAQPAGGIAGDTAKTPGKFEGKGLFLMFLLVFLGGLALNLTPCVYPIIPITISYFGGQSQGKKGSVVAHSVLYVIGMAVTYSILGMIAAFTGSLFGTALQYPPVLIGIALIMIILALSMFNVYELRVPAFLNKIAGGSRKGFFGTFFMGLTVGIVAAPCIGPFVLGLLTYVGDKGNLLLGFLLFFVLALGLGVPFLFLGIFSGSISRLPRSGAWMVWVRTIFGFILIAMAIYFLKPLFPSALFYSLALALTMFVAGIYMAWIEPTKTPGKAFPYIRNIVGIIFFGIGLYVAASGIQGYLDKEIAAKTSSLAAEKGSAAVTNSVRWYPYSEEIIAEAARTGRPVLIDFWADWCIACKELDKKTFSEPEVIEASKSFVMLKVDSTSAKDLEAKAVCQKYLVKGFPTLVFLAADGKEIEALRVTGFEPKKDFLPKMLKTLELGKKGT